MKQSLFRPNKTFNTATWYNSPVANKWIASKEIGFAVDTFHFPNKLMEPFYLKTHSKV